MIYLIIATLYNYFTGKGLKYVIGLTIVMSIKDSIIIFSIGIKKNMDFHRNRYNIK